MQLETSRSPSSAREHGQRLACAEQSSQRAGPSLGSALLLGTVRLQLKHFSVPAKRCDTPISCKADVVAWSLGRYRLYCEVLVT